MENVLPFYVPAWKLCEKMGKCPIFVPALICHQSLKNAKGHNLNQRKCTHKHKI